MSQKIRVMICDDHVLFTEGIKAILREDPTIEVIAETRDGREAVDRALELRPDIVLMDIEMAGLSGFEATRLIREAEPTIQIIILTMYNDEDMVARCLEAGASGFVLKDVPPSQLVYAINAVSAGGKYMSPGPLKWMVERYVTQDGQAQTRYDLLTNREREILKLLADGLSIKEIATRLNLSVKTVEVHKYNLMNKLDIHDRSELIKYAIQKRLIRVS